MPMQYLVQHLPARDRMIYPVNIFIRISVVVMVLQRQISPRNPAYVQERITPHLDYSPAADAPGMVQVFHFQNRIPVAENPPRQPPTIRPFLVKLKGIWYRRIQERMPL